MRHLSLVIRGTAVLFAMGCSTDDTPRGVMGPGGAAPVSFSADIRDIIARGGCTSASCHGAAAALGLDLRPGADYGSLVNVTAVEDNSKKRVLPGDAQNSYIVIKVEGRQTVGGRMPLGGTPLDSIDVTNLRNWIDQGALDN